MGASVKMPGGCVKIMYQFDKEGVDGIFGRRFGGPEKPCGGGNEGCVENPL
jgi:hypothetical protein